MTGTQEEATLDGYYFYVRNFADDMVRPSNAHFIAKVDGVKLFEAKNPEMNLIAKGQQLRMEMIPQLKWQIPRSARTMTVSFDVTYDTVPPSGLRHSHRTIIYDLSWPNPGPGNYPAYSLRITDEVED